MYTLNVQEWRGAGLSLRKGGNEAHGLRKSTYCCSSKQALAVPAAVCDKIPSLVWAVQKWNCCGLWALMFGH